MLLKDKKVFLTGAGGGLGKSLIKKFIEEGSYLILTDRNTDLVVKGLKDIGIDKYHHQILDIVAIDLGSESQIENYFDNLDKESKYEIDIVVNNACSMVFGAFVNIPLRKWKNDLAVSLMAPMQIIQRFLPNMIARNSGYLVNINSLVSLSVQKYKSSYAVSKIGFKMFADILHEEIEQYDIKMTNIFPYFIKTPILYNVETFGLDNKKLIDEALADEPDEIALQIIEGIKNEKYEVYVGSAERCLRYSKLHSTK